VLSCGFLAGVQWLPCTAQQQPRAFQGWSALPPACGPGRRAQVPHHLPEFTLCCHHTCLYITFCCKECTRLQVQDLAHKGWKLPLFLPDDWALEDSAVCGAVLWAARPAASPQRASSDQLAACKIALLSILGSACVCDGCCFTDGLAQLPPSAHQLPPSTHHCRQALKAVSKYCVLVQKYCLKVLFCGADVLSPTMKATKMHSCC
jgi:hypothetical protein